MPIVEKAYFNGGWYISSIHNQMTVLRQLIKFVEEFKRPPSKNDLDAYLKSNNVEISTQAVLYMLEYNGLIRLINPRIKRVYTGMSRIFYAPIDVKFTDESIYESIISNNIEYRNFNYECIDLYELVLEEIEKNIQENNYHIFREDVIEKAMEKFFEWTKETTKMKVSMVLNVLCKRGILKKERVCKYKYNGYKIVRGR